MRSKKDNTIVFGRQAVYNLLDSGATIERIFVQAGLRGEILDDIHALAKQKLIHLQSVPMVKLNRLTPGTHQGVVAIRSLIHYYDINDIMMQAYERGESPLFILTDGVTDVRNLGAIARSAECFGVHALIHPYEESAQINSITIETSAGALNHIHVCRVQQANDAVRFLQHNGIKILCATEDAADSIKEMDFKTPCCIVMGAEDVGISKKIMKTADHLFKIPMTGKTGSFNVSVAAGIILYEVFSQRF